MVPRTVYVVPLHVEPGLHDVKIDFPGVPGAEQTWQGISVPDAGEATYIVRIQPYHPGPFVWRDSSPRSE